MCQLSGQFRIVVNNQIHVSPPVSADVPALVAHLNEKAIFDRTLRIPLPYASEDALEFVRIADESTKQHGHPVNFLIRDADGVAIGGIGFDGLKYGHRAEVGYWLAKPLWGRGIMTQVVAAMCQFVFANWKLVRISAHVFAPNAASARVLEKNSFELEGMRRKLHQKGDRFIDAMAYALVP